MHKFVAGMLSCGLILAGCSKHDEPPKTQTMNDRIEEALLSSHADKAGVAGIPIQLNAIQSAADSFTLLLASDDGQCRYTVTARESKGNIAFDPSVVQICGAASPSQVIAMIAPRNEPADIERCKAYSKDNERTLCFTQLDGNNRALTLVVSKG